MWPEESHLGSWGTLTQLYLDPWHLPQKRFSGQVKAKQSEWLYWLSKKMTHLKGVRVSEPVCVHVREMQMCSGDAAFGTLKLLHLQLIWNLLGKVVPPLIHRILLLKRSVVSTLSGLQSEKEGLAEVEHHQEGVLLTSKSQMVALKASFFSIF